MTSLVNSRLLFVVLVLQLAAGALLLAGVVIPLALTVLLAFDVRLDFFSLGDTGDGSINWLAILATAAVVLWGSIGGVRKPEAATT
jgi:uncharacterized BrkB/YihY/UPF0761 family membrane protein